MGGRQGVLGGMAVLGLLAGLAACQSGDDVDPISVGDSAPGGCPAGTLSRPTPAGAAACFAGGGCPDGQVPVRIDGPLGATVSCGQLGAGGCGTGWSAGSVADSALCLAQAPCAAPVNRTTVNNGVWTVVLDCSAG